jgi:hypothetical protein
LTDFTPTTFNPNTEVAISALVIALSIACFIRLFLVSSNLLSDNVKSTLFTVLAPEAIAVSIHLDTFLMFVLCIWIKLDTVNPVIFPTVSEGRE